MPRGRPKKAASVAVTEPSKKPVETIEPAQEATIPIFSAPVAGPVTEPIIEESKDSNEAVEDIDKDAQGGDTSANVGSSALLMWNRAEQELKRLHSKRGTLEIAINEKQRLRNTLQFQHQKAEAFYREALDAFNTLKHETSLQQQRVLLGEGTPIHAEMKEELTRLNDEYDSARATLHGAQKNLEDTRHALTGSDSLLAECDQHQAELEQVMTDIATMETLRDEWKAKRGREVEQSIIDGINEARDAQRRAKEASKARMQAALERIESELDEWPELIEEIAEAFHESVEDIEDNPGRVEDTQKAKVHEVEEDAAAQTSNPTVKLCYAWITFLQALREHGPQSKRFINGVNLVDTLSLQPGRMLHFMQPSNWRYVRERDASGREIYRWSNNEIEIVHDIIQQEQTSTQDAFWGTLPSQRW